MSYTAYAINVMIGSCQLTANFFRFAMQPHLAIAMLGHWRAPHTVKSKSWEGTLERHQNPVI